MWAEPIKKIEKTYNFLTDAFDFLMMVVIFLKRRHVSSRSVQCSVFSRSLVTARKRVKTNRC